MQQHERRRGRRNLHNTARTSYRSREIWDETRKPNSTYMDLFRAICYELQPGIPLFSLGSFLKENNIVPFVYDLIKFFWMDIIYKRVYKTWSIKEYVYFLILPCLYWCLVVYVHELLHAGPMFLILTALVLILTIGLSDENNNNGDASSSAYSVFNRGFTRLLGSVDVESLINQHVGGGVMMLAGAGGVNDNNNINNRQQRVPPQQANAQAEAEAEQAENNNNNNNNNNVQQPQQNRARKSGKKARRRTNVEQRRERQRQRQAAADLNNLDILQEQEEDEELQRVLVQEWI